MSASTTMTIRLSAELKDKLDRMAADTRRSKSFLAAEAIETFVDRDLRIMEMIKEGQADVAAGNVIPHDEVVAEMREIIADARARQAAKPA